MAEGLCLALFGKSEILPVSIILMLAMSILVQMAEGATFAMVPFIEPDSRGAVGGLVAAGGNVGALLLGLAFSLSGESLGANFSLTGLVVSGVSILIYGKFLWSRRAVKSKDYKSEAFAALPD